MSEEQGKTSILKIVGIIVLTIVVSVVVYNYMDYQEKAREQEYLSKAIRQTWDEEVAYYEKLAEEVDWLYVKYELVFSDGSTENMVDWELKYGGITDVLNCSRQQMLHEMEYYMSTGDGAGPSRINLCIDKTAKVIYFLQIYQWNDMYDVFHTRIIFTYWSREKYIA